MTTSLHSKDTDKAHSKSTTLATAEISKVSVAFIALTAGLIGCWATASLFAGLVTSGGPIGLIQNFITALIG